MESPNPVWFIVAAVIVGCMALSGIGILFVRARNIERRWLVAIATLIGATIGTYLLSTQPVWAGGRGVALPWLAGLISVLGFIVGRAVDAMLGPRPPSAMRPDRSTYGADLAE